MKVFKIKAASVTSLALYGAFFGALFGLTACEIPGLNVRDLYLSEAEDKGTEIPAEATTVQMETQVEVLANMDQGAIQNTAASGQNPNAGVASDVVNSIEQLLTNLSAFPVKFRLMSTTGIPATVPSVQYSGSNSLSGCAAALAQGASAGLQSMPGSSATQHHCTLWSRPSAGAIFSLSFDPISEGLNERVASASALSESILNVYGIHAVLDAATTSVTSRNENRSICNLLRRLVARDPAGNRLISEWNKPVSLLFFSHYDLAASLSGCDALKSEAIEQITSAGGVNPPADPNGSPAVAAAVCSGNKGVTSAAAANIIALASPAPAFPSKVVTLSEWRDIPRHGADISLQSGSFQTSNVPVYLVQYVRKNYQYVLVAITYEKMISANSYGSPVTVNVKCMLNDAGVFSPRGDDKHNWLCQLPLTTNLTVITSSTSDLRSHFTSLPSQYNGFSSTQKACSSGLSSYMSSQYAGAASIRNCAVSALSLTAAEQVPFSSYQQFYGKPASTLTTAPNCLSTLAYFGDEGTSSGPVNSAAKFNSSSGVVTIGSFEERSASVVVSPAIAMGEGRVGCLRVARVFPQYSLLQPAGRSIAYKFTYSNFDFTLNPSEFQFSSPSSTISNIQYAWAAQNLQMSASNILASSLNWQPSSASGNLPTISSSGVALSALTMSSVAATALGASADGQTLSAFKYRFSLADRDKCLLPAGSPTPTPTPTATPVVGPVVTYQTNQVQLFDWFSFGSDGSLLPRIDWLRGQSAGNAPTALPSRAGESSGDLLGIALVNILKQLPHSNVQIGFVTPTGCSWRAGSGEKAPEYLKVVNKINELYAKQIPQYLDCAGVDSAHSGCDPKRARMYSICNPSAMAQAVSRIRDFAATNVSTRYQIPEGKWPVGAEVLRVEAKGSVGGWRSLQVSNPRVTVISGQYYLDLGDINAQELLGVKYFKLFRKSRLLSN